jgi:multidrug resistance efflux pump
MKNKSLFSIAICMLGILSACSNIPFGVNNSNGMDASGIITATEFQIASEIGGRVSELFVEEGQKVEAGKPLFKLDDRLMKSQYEQAQAGLKTAEVTLEASQLQYDLTLSQYQSIDKTKRNLTWRSSKISSEFDQPVWYFSKEELIASAQKIADSAQKDREDAISSLEKTLDNIEGGKFVAAEERLSDAQAAYYIADQVLDLAKQAKDNDELKSSAENDEKAAKAELDSAQTEYDKLLTTQAADDVLEARAKLQVAQARYDHALDRLIELRTGINSLEVAAAEALVRQAQANVNQAKQAVNTLEIQMEKLAVNSPVDGIVMNLNIDISEVISPGMTVITIGQLEKVNLIIYISEEVYGKIKLGDQVQVRVDSFPGETFTGEVIHIADEA